MWFVCVDWLFQMWGNDYFAKEYADSEELTVFYEQANGQLWFAHI